ncbi:Immunoglobulin kappa variable 5-2 [Dissostichus eleginoides]|nr:Immunoglobulin kappa variable 5-2 [Dissostichus eleginoides]
MIRFLFCCCRLSGFSLGLDVRQSPSDLIKSPGDKVQISCSHDRTDYRLILWYQRSPGDTALKLIGYLNYQAVTMEQPFEEESPLNFTKTLNHLLS